MKTINLLAIAFAAVIGVACLSPVQAQNAGMPENVLKVIKNNKDLSKFADLISSAGAESDFTQKTNTTIFAPNNAAMDKIPSDVMKKAKTEKDGLKTLVRYHVISGSAVYAGNIKGRRASPSSANGEMIGFDGTGAELKVNEAVIKTPDLKALNGVVHVINAPLLPLSMNDAAQAKIKEHEEAERKKLEAEMKEREEKMNAERAKAEAKMAKDTKDSAKKNAKDQPEVKVPEVPSPAAAEAPAAPAAPQAPTSSSAKAVEEKPSWKKMFGF